MSEKKKVAILSYVIPKEIATEAEMDALLEVAEIGSVYKYVGPACKYESGSIYIVEEEN